MTRAYVLDPGTRAILGLVDQSWERLHLHPPLHGDGHVHLVINRSRLWASELAKNRLLYLPDEGDLVFLIEQVESTAEGSTRNDAMTVSGRSLEGIAMAERLVLPPPGESHDRVTGGPGRDGGQALPPRPRGRPRRRGAPAARARPSAPTRRAAHRSPSPAATRACSTSCARSASWPGMGWEVTYDAATDAFVFDVLVGADR